MKLNKKKNKSENTVHYQFVNSKHIKTCKIIPKYTNSKLRNDLSKKCIKVYKEKRKPSLTRCTRSSSPKYRFLPLNHPVHRGQGHNTLPSLSVDHCSQRSRVYQSTSQKDPSRLIPPSPFSIVTRNTFSPENIVATGETSSGYTLNDTSRRNKRCRVMYLIINGVNASQNIIIVSLVPWRISFLLSE